MPINGAPLAVDHVVVGYVYVDTDGRFVTHVTNGQAKDHLKKLIMNHQLNMVNVSLDYIEGESVIHMSRIERATYAGKSDQRS